MIFLPTRLFLISYRFPFPKSPSFQTLRTFTPMSSTESINQEIAQQTALFNELRLQKADSTAIDEAKKKLGDLKRSLALLGGNSASGSGSKDAGKKRERLLLKTGKVSCPIENRLPEN
jgi:hypothetical protein